jgi:2,5-dioxopentanoate dehydrogenase
MTNDMDISGDLLIGAGRRRGTHGEFCAIEAATGNRIAPAFGGASAADLNEACALAADAFDDYRALPLERRAAFLESIAQNILDIGDALIERAMQETGLPRARLEGERARTVGQLRMFAGVVRDGGFLDLRIDPAQPDRKPLPRVDLRLRNIPLGPVAVFGASNFPLAFSVAGGDTAAALAAGCPVVVKAHSAHPGTSELVGRAVHKAVADCELPAGTFSLLFVDDRGVAQALVADPRIKAVGFTGSRIAGTTLMKIAAERPEPIPVYAEMSSINPVLLFPAALAARGAKIGEAFVASLTMGAGQFCTNPGLILALEGRGLDDFLTAASGEVRQATAATMLTPGILAAYNRGVAALRDHPAVETAASGASDGAMKASPSLHVTSAAHFLAHPELHEEVFGAASLVVRCPDLGSMVQVLESLEGQLTAALHIDEGDHDVARQILPLLERKVGRILVNGFGTGVEVAHAMVHGGPYPSTADGRSTSVGSLAIARFLRPVSYQDLPEALLPPELQTADASGLPTRVDGKLKL